MASNSLTQYLELYREIGADICSHAPKAFNDLRPAALEALQAAGRLPERGEEGYDKLSVNDMFAPDFGINVNRLGFPVDTTATFKCDVPTISTLLGITVNDVFRPTAALQRNLPEGVTVMSLAEAAVVHPEMVEPYLGKLAGNKTPMTALNTLLMQDGVLIHVAKNVQAAKAIQIVNIFNAGMPLLAARRVLIVVERNAEARVLMCDHTQNDSFDYLASQVVEVVLQENARLDLYDIEESGLKTSRYCEVYVEQAADSRLLTNYTTLSGGTTRNTFNVELNGEHSDTRLGGMVIGGAGQTVDNASTVCHHVPRCHSNQLFKYALFDDAKGAFEGTIVVDEPATFTEAYQSNRNLVASPDARMHTRPQLEIYCDEVKCSHGATTGQLDADALFYMRQRGIPEDEARRMLIQAFMIDVIDTIALDGLRERMRMLVDKRLNGDEAGCGDCSASCHAPDSDQTNQ
jgi:Fe-S cluster assembly protein SufD